MTRQQCSFYADHKAVLFCLCIISLLVLVANIPFDLLMQKGTLKPYSHDLNGILHGIIIISICSIIAKEYQLITRVRFANTTGKRNYWMLLIPLFFPGLLTVSHFSMDCFTGFATPALFILALLISGWVEEMTFRGLIQGYLTNRYPGKSNHRICVTTAIFFAVIHFNNLQHVGLSSVINQIIYAFYMGLVFSALMIRVNNVWLLGIAHGLLNFLSLSCPNKQTVVANIPVDVPLQDQFVQVIAMGLLYSPLLLIYLLLLKGAGKPKLNRDATILYSGK